VKDMRNFYFNMTTNELRVLQRKKLIRVQHLQSKKLGYFDQQELRKLKQQLDWIRAVLESRSAQKSFLQ